MSSKVLSSFNDFTVSEAMKPKMRSFQKLQPPKVQLYNCLDHSSSTVEPGPALR